MKEIAEYFRSYAANHPLRQLLENGCDKDLKPLLPNGFVAFNLLQPLFRELQRLRQISRDAYVAFVSDKLAAKRGSDDVDVHNLVSALCELSVMNTFISASEQPDSFVYEPRLVENSSKNVEFSIIVGGMLFEVEVKSANMLDHAVELANNMKKEGQVIEPNARLIPFDQWQCIAGEIPLMGSLDNKVADFLASAQEKFPPVNDSIHLLAICWDGRYRKALTALKSKNSGLLTSNTYRPELSYDHISHIIVASQYGLVINWLQGILPSYAAQDPLSLRFAINCLIDFNLDNPKEIHDILSRILGYQDLPIVNEEYVEKNCEDVTFTIDLPRKNREID